MEHQNRRRNKTVSNELRQLIVSAHERGERNRDIARWSTVPVSNVRNIIRMFEIHGRVDRLPTGKTVHI